MTAKEAYKIVLKKVKNADVGVCIDLGDKGFVFSYSKDEDVTDPYVIVDKKNGDIYPFVLMEHDEEIDEAIDKGLVTTDIDSLK